MWLPRIWNWPIAHHGYYTIANEGIKCWPCNTSRVLTAMCCTMNEKSNHDTLDRKTRARVTNIGIVGFCMSFVHMTLDIIFSCAKDHDEDPNQLHQYSINCTNLKNIQIPKLIRNALEIFLGQIILWWHLQYMDLVEQLFGIE